MVLVNTFFTKNEEHLVTYKSGGHSSEIDYMMVKGQGQARVKDCKVIPGEPAVTQHRLLCMKFKVGHEKRRKKPVWREKIKPWKLKNVENKRAFQEKVGSPEMSGSANDKWHQIKNVVMKAAEEVCGKSKGGRGEKKETWK